MSTAAVTANTWERDQRWWHVAFAFVLALTIALTWVGPGSAGSHALVVALLAALVACYAATQRRCRGATPGRAGPAYASAAIAVFAAVVVLTPAGFVLLFMIAPQIFAVMEDFRASVAPAVALHVAMAVGVARWHDPPFTAGAWLAAALQTAVILVFSLALGAYIHRIVAQSQERATLIDELRAARVALDDAQREAGVLAERQRLAGEIHDTLAQGFTSIVLLVQAAAALSPPDHPARAQLQAIEDTARDNLAEARALVAELTPPALAGGPLAAAAGRLVERLGPEVGLDAALTVAGTPRGLGANHDIALLRALQETLANVRRHAGASRVRVGLDYGAERVTLRVADDGRGFDPAQATAGYGLRGMAKRIEQLGGMVLVEAEPGAGTTVTVTMALEGSR